MDLELRLLEEGYLPRKGKNIPMADVARCLSETFSCSTYRNPAPMLLFEGPASCAYLDGEERQEIASKRLALAVSNQEVNKSGFFHLYSLDPEDRSAPILIPRALSVTLFPVLSERGTAVVKASPCYRSKQEFYRIEISKQPRTRVYQIPRDVEMATIGMWNRMARDAGLRRVGKLTYRGNTAGNDIYFWASTRENTHSLTVGPLALGQPVGDMGKSGGSEDYWTHDLSIRVVAVHPRDSRTERLGSVEFQGVKGQGRDFSTLIERILAREHRR